MMNNKNTEIDNLLIRLVATSQKPISRVDLAKMTGLNKMTIGRHVANMIQKGLLVEYVDTFAEHGIGRIPSTLFLSDAFPCVCGILLKRSYIQFSLANISGRILYTTKEYFGDDLTEEKLKRMLISCYDETVSHTNRVVCGIGIACMGPIDSETGEILELVDFYGISNFPIRDILNKHSKVPVFLIHDASAGALAERIYGRGMNSDNYLYLHVEEGIGMGFIHNGELFNGLSGKSGEIGHTSIDFNGPRCSCGNRGCLELYANVEQMRKKISELLPFSPKSALATMREPNWQDIVTLAAQGDMVALAALDEFCGYLGHAIANTLTLMNFPLLIIGSESVKISIVITKLLSSKLKNIHTSAGQNFQVRHSDFDNAPLIGAIAVVAEEVFQHRILV